MPNAQPPCCVQHTDNDDTTYATDEDERGETGGTGVNGMDADRTLDERFETLLEELC